ncbi:meiotic activator RIM4 [Fusarium beomiforme]|uniref:Meiotic activator RIM4 n=1 Tax=Fusarium beomiforme TaxID=44412 RepID=A0A9P5A6D3_9HYPO|nr:meiotic activator RIM4 [Fusarium beomiforme]
MPTQYRTPHAVASTDRTLRNAFSALNFHYSGDDEESESDGSPRSSSSRPLSNSKSMPSLVQEDEIARIGHISNNTRDEGKVTVDSPEGLDPTAYVTTGQDSNLEDTLDGAIMSMTEAVQTIAALPANAEADANTPRDFDAQSVYPGDACLFVANLPQHVDDLTLRASLTKHFGKFGTVFVKIKRDRKTHMPMAFVQYTQIMHADVAVHKARGNIIHGRPIRVEKCGGNLAYIIFRKNTRPVHFDEARSIFSPYGPIEKIEVLDHHAQTQLDVPSSLLVQYSRFDAKREVIRDVGPATPFIIMAFDPKMVQKRSERPPDDQTFMEMYEKDCRSVFFGGLPHYTDEAMVYRLASICGNVRSVDLRRSPDQDGGLPHPWAFVEYDEFDVPDAAIREFNGKEVEGCFLRVERKRSKTATESRTPGPRVTGTQMRDSTSRKLHASTDDARMYPSPLRPIKRPHRRFSSRVASIAAAPTAHRRVLSTAGISKEEREFLMIHRPQDILEPEKTQPKNTQPRPLPVPKLSVSSSKLDEVTPVQSPDKYPAVADPGNMVRFAPSSPDTLPSNAGSSPIPPQIPAPPAEFSPPNLRSFKERLADVGHLGVMAFSPAAELAAVRCEAAVEDKANGKGHRRAVSMFITTNHPPPIDVSESDDSTWRTSGSSQDEQEFRDKKAKSRNRLRRLHLSEENLKRNLLYQAKLKRAYASEENMRGRPISRGTVRSRGKSGKSRKRSDATVRAPEEQVVVASQQVPESQPVVTAQHPDYQPAMTYNHMVPQYPPAMPPMGYMPMQPQAMAPAPGGFTYMDMPHQHPHPQLHEPFQMYQGPSQHQYAGPSQVPYPHILPMYPQGQPPMPFQGHPQPDYREPIHMSQDARNYQYPGHGGPQFQGRRHASYAHPQQMQYQGSTYTSMPHPNMTPIAPRRPSESYHSQRQRREAERYHRYNS